LAGINKDPLRPVPLAEPMRDTPFGNFHPGASVPRLTSNHHSIVEKRPNVGLQFGQKGAKSKGGIVAKDWYPGVKKRVTVRSTLEVKEIDIKPAPTGSARLGKLCMD